MSIDDPAIQAFLAHTQQLAQENGVELDDQDTLQLLEASQQGGFTPEATAQAFNSLFDYADDEDDFDEDDFDDEADDAGDEEELSPANEAFAADLGADLERLKGLLGRPLRDDEQEAYVTNAAQQVNRTGIYDRDKAAEGFKGYADMTREEANDAMVARARELDPPPEPDENRVLDIHDNRADFEEYARLRLEGGMGQDDFHAVDVPDQDAA